MTKFEGPSDSTETFFLGYYQDTTDLIAIDSPVRAGHYHCLKEDLSTIFDDMNIESQENSLEALKQEEGYLTNHTKSALNKFYT